MLLLLIKELHEGEILDWSTPEIIKIISWHNSVPVGNSQCHNYGSFYPSMRNILFPFSSHCDVISSNKLRCCLINIYDELVWNVVLKDFISNFVKKLWSPFSSQRPGNYWPWCSDCVILKFHPLVQWSHPWSCQFKIHILAKFFWVSANEAI